MASDLELKRQMQEATSLTKTLERTGRLDLFRELRLRVDREYRQAVKEKFKQLAETSYLQFATYKPEVWFLAFVLPKMGTTNFFFPMVEIVPRGPSNRALFYGVGGTNSVPSVRTTARKLSVVGVGELGTSSNVNPNLIASVESCRGIPKFLGLCTEKIRNSYFYRGLLGTSTITALLQRSGLSEE